MNVRSPQQTAEAYFEAWSNKDFDGARSLLHDDVSFLGPFDTFDNADDLIQAITGLGQLIKGLEMRRVFTNGQDVCIIYDLVPNKAVASVPIAEWYQVRDGKISAISIIFDTGAFSAIFDS